MNLRRSTAVLMLCGLPLAGCSATVPAAVQTVTQTATVTETQIITATVEAPTVTVTPAPVTMSVTVESASPNDVTDTYVAWRRTHPPENDTDRQYQAVQQALLNGGQLDVVTVYKAPGWGWNCQGEPTEISGRQLNTIRILNQDGSVFRFCRPGTT